MNQMPVSKSTPPDPLWQTLAEIALPGELNSNHLVGGKIAEAVQELALSPAHLKRLKTAVVEAVVNAIEHEPDLPVIIRIQVTKKALPVYISEHGQNESISKSQKPNPAAKLSHGWGFFLVEKMVDRLSINSDKAYHTIELFLYLEGGNDELQES